MRIDLNADVGEGMESDPALIPLLSSCSIACGGHAGDKATMRQCLTLAEEVGVTAGAHPSYPDPEGFGRRVLTIDDNDLADSLSAQLQALRHEAEDLGVTLRHVKPHGALYNQAAKDKRLADLIVDVTVRELPGAALMGLPGSAMAKAANQRGISFLAEGFVDRAYCADGSLVPRTEAGAVLTENGQRRAQAMALARGMPMATPEGAITLSVQTLCIHGDSPGAMETAKAVRQALENAGVIIAAAHG